MRNSVKIFVGALVTLLLTGSIFAQKAHKDFDPEKRAEKMTAHLTEALELNPEQATKIKAIALKFGVRKAAMRDQNTTSDRSAMRSAKKQMRTDFEAEIQSVLTEEQYQKFQELPKKGHRGGHHGKKRGKDKGGKHAALKEKMKPLLLEQRAKLESKLSEEDKVRIAQLRVKVKAEKEAHRIERKARKAEGATPPSKEERKARREAHKNSPTHLALVELTEKYHADIEALLTEIKPQVEALKKELKEGNSDRKKGNRAKQNRARHSNKKHARFLLLDPNASEDEAPLTPISMISDVNIYPNPSQGISQIEYELKEASSVLIELRDKEGNLIDTIERANKTAGQHKTSVNLSQYTVGIYYVVLKDSNGQTISKKVIR